MADAYNSTSTLSNLVKTGYDRKFRLALRSLPQFRSIADVKPANETNPGDSVAFHIYSDLAPVTTPLNEITDPDAVANAQPTPISVQLVERGNYQVTTRRLRAFTLDPKTDGNLANILAYNMVDSLDAVVRAKLDGCTQIVKEVGGSLAVTGAVTGVTPADVHKARDYRYAITKLRASSVMPFRGDKFGVFIHPEAALDLRTETGAAAWRTPQEYQQVEKLEAGEIGTWEGGIFMETPRATNAQVGSGSGGTQTRVFNSYVFGQEALAEAVAEEPHLVLDGVVVDPLKRKIAAGWYGIIGWERFRPESLWLVQGASSIHPNA